MPEDVASDRRGTPNGLPRLTRFEVVRRVGEGGAGLVYEAIDRDRKARVALKMLRVLDGEMLLRLKEEFRSLQDIEHPNLIRLFELSCDEGTWFFTMELLEGEHFNDYVCGEASPLSRSQLRDPGGVPAKDARQETTGVRPVRPERAPRAVDYPKLRDAFVQLARGLVALHQAGKVHRDIKPSNVLVQRDGRVVILDLGLVHDSRDALPMDADLVVGTISHMAPEQAAGDDVGPAADWYSVGTVLYQCLTGRHPFEGAASDVLERKQVEDPPRPRDVVPGVPDDLDALCMALLAREPAARPKGAEVLRLLESLPASERPPARASGQTPWVG